MDGNGRLSRVPTTLLLLPAGYDYVPYSSLVSALTRAGHLTRHGKGRGTWSGLI